MAKRALSPALARHAAAVKATHAHLSKTDPGFRAKPPAAQFRLVQRHLRRQKGGY
jgi:hypothetical protein